ncbi:kinase A anchor protein [Tricladium varicosporioides]|nr:kinase A anchor protein [Hymenoscyphus varicosporioides]
MPPKSPAPRLTHFLCIPLVTPSSRSQLQTSLNAFREKVTGVRTAKNPSGIPEAAVRPLGTLHLTLGVMSLQEQDKVDKALNLLKELDLRSLILPVKDVVVKPEVSGGKEVESFAPLTVALKGLESMHTPSKTSILYAPPANDPRLREFCRSLREAFASEALLDGNDTRPLLLHATILNTIYVPSARGRGGGHGKSRAKFTIDATEILEDYEEYEWMEETRIEKIAICKMGARKADDGGEEYVVEGEVSMPQ